MDSLNRDGDDRDGASYATRLSGGAAVKWPNRSTVKLAQFSLSLSHPHSSHAKPTPISSRGRAEAGRAPIHVTGFPRFLNIDLILAHREAKPSLDNVAKRANYEV